MAGTTEKPKREAAGRALLRMPEWMLETGNTHVRESMQTDRDLWVTAAEFDSLRAGDWGGRLSLIMSARGVGQAASIAQWRDTVHGDFALTTQVDMLNNHDKLARSFYVRAALLRLLELVEAPDALKMEVQRLTNQRLPKSAPKRGALQAALIDHPHLADNPAALAKTVGCDRHLVDRYLSDGSVQRVP